MKERTTITTVTLKCTAADKIRMAAFLSLKFSVLVLTLVSPLPTIWFCVNIRVPCNGELHIIWFVER